MIGIKVSFLFLIMAMDLCSSFKSVYFKHSRDKANIQMNLFENSDSIAKAKLKAEVRTPFRLLRFFIYGGVASAGALGSFTAIPQLYLSFQNSNELNIDKSNAITNVVVDVGGVIGAVLLWRKESTDQKKLIDSYIAKQLKLDNSLSPTAIEERQQQLSLLPVEIQISEIDANVTRVVSLKDLQIRGLQNIIVIAGNYEFVKDSLISARLEGILME